MSIFKCESCDSYRDGEGTDKCLNCAEYKYVGQERSRVVVEYYANPFEEIPAPEDWESLYGASRSNGVWELINKLDWREATMLTQYHFLEMKQEDIAEYHNINQATVHRIITRSIKKIREM